MTRKLLAADMWPALTFGNPNETYADFLAVGRPRFKNLLEALLLFDEIHVPTDSFMSLALLVGVLGEQPVLELLDCGVLKFLRFQGGVVYVGNGGGLSAYEIGEKGPGKSTPVFGPADEAINWALSGLNSKPDIRALTPKVIAATQELKTSDLMQTVKDRTYKTILGSTELRKDFSVRNTSFDYLAGIKPNEVRTWGGFDKPTATAPDEIDVVLRIARSYMEALGAEQIGGADVNTATPIGYVIEREEARQHIDFSVLREIAGIPDVGEGILKNQLSMHDVIKLRGSYHWPRFRDWFHGHCSGNPIEVSKAYIELLKETPAADGLPGRTVRFIATTALGFLGPLAGIASAAVDTYVVPNVHPPSAKFFIEKLEQLASKQRHGL